MALDPNQAEEYAKRVREAEQATQEAANSSRDLKEQLRDVLFFTRDYADEAKKAAKEVHGSTIGASETAKAFKDVASSAKKISDNYAEVLTGEKKYKDLLKEREALNIAQRSFNTEHEQFLQTLQMSQSDINGILDGSIDTYEAIGRAGVDMSDSQLNLLELYKLQNVQLKDEADNIDEVAKRAATIEDAMGGQAVGLGDLASGLDGAMKKSGLGDIADKMDIQGAVGEARELAGSLTEGGTKAAGMGGKMKVAGKMASSIGKNLMKSLGPAALLAFAIEGLVNAFKMIDGKSGELAKEFGVSAAEGQKLVKSANKAAGASGDLLTSTTDLIVAQQTLNNLYGTAVQFPAEMASEFAMISERTGLSADAMKTFSSLALTTGSTIKDQLKDITLTTLEMNSQSGISLNMKQVQEGISKASSSALLMAGRSTKELTRQVFAAKALGVEQSKVEAIGDSLLDFESSISKELEAELLLGRDLNLEKARAAALDGDRATVAEEIKKQVGSTADFMELNTIEAEALAAAVGMTREELSASMIEADNLAALQKNGFDSISDAQNQYNALRAEGYSEEEAALAIGDKALANQFESATMADKMAAAQEKIQDLFVAIMGALMPVFNILVDILEDVLNPIMEALNPILALFGELLGAILKPIAKILQAAIKPIIETMVPIVNELFAAFSEIGESLSGIFGEAEEGSGILETIGNIIGTFILIPMQRTMSVITSIISSIASGLKPIMETMAPIVDELFASFSEIGESLSGIFGEIGESLSGIFGEAEEGSGIIETIGDIIGTFILIPIQMTMSVISAIIGALSGLADMFSGIGMMIEGDFLGGFKKIGKGLMKILTAPFQAMIDVAIATINAIIKQVNRIPGVNFDEFGGVNIMESLGMGDDEKEKEEENSTSTAPSGAIGLASGGIVTSPTRALIGEGGEPEAVIPLSKANSVGFGGNEDISYKAIVTALKELSTDITSEVGAISTSIAKLLQGIVSPVIEKNPSGPDTPSTPGSDNGILESINLTPIVDEMAVAFGKVGESLSGIFGESTEIGDIFTTIGNIISTVVMVGMNGVMVIISSITNRIKGLAETFGGFGDIISGDFLGGFKKIGTGLLKILTSPLQAMLDVATGVINTIINQVNKIPGVNFDTFGEVNIMDNIIGKEDEETSQPIEGGNADISSKAIVTAMDNIIGKEDEETSQPIEGGNADISSKAIVTAPKELSTDITPEDQIKQVAIPPPNNDHEIGELIENSSISEPAVPNSTTVNEPKSTLLNANPSGFGGNEKVVQLLERLISVVEKGGVVELDGNKVGTALGMASYKTQ